MSWVWKRPLRVLSNGVEEDRIATVGGRRGQGCWGIVWKHCGVGVEDIHMEMRLHGLVAGCGSEVGTC